MWCLLGSIKISAQQKPNNGQPECPSQTDRIRQPPEKLTKDQSNLLTPELLLWVDRTGAVCSEARCIFTEREREREREREGEAEREAEREGDTKRRQDESEREREEQTARERKVRELFQTDTKAVTRKALNTHSLTFFTYSSLQLILN